MSSQDPESYTVGNIASGRISIAEQIKDEEPD